MSAPDPKEHHLFSQYPERENLLSRGLAKGLIVIGGRTKSGKTTLAAQIVHSAILLPRHHRLVEAEEKGKKEGETPETPEPPMILTLEDPDELLSEVVSVDAKEKEGLSLMKLGLTTAANPGAKVSGGISMGRDSVGPYLVRKEKEEDKESELMAHVCTRLLYGDKETREKRLERCLKTALRQTTTLVYVGELREKFAWRLAYEFARTGHTIMATAHAGSIADVFGQLFDNLEAHTPGQRAQVAQVLVGILHQRQAHSAELKSVYLPSLWWSTPTSVKQIATMGLSSLLPRLGSDEDRSGGVIAKATRLRDLYLDLRDDYVAEDILSPEKPGAWSTLHNVLVERFNKVVRAYVDDASAGALIPPSGPSSNETKVVDDYRKAFANILNRCMKAKWRADEKNLAERRMALDEGLANLVRQRSAQRSAYRKVLGEILKEEIIAA
ncbi:MAG: ATPase, T2SS/T4P/T4SS family [Limisphaerales bacterium]